VSEKAFNRVLLVSMAVLVVLLVFVATGALAQTGALTHPRWVSDSPAAGQWIPTWTIAAADTGGVRAVPGVRAIECVAATETKFTAYWYVKGQGTDKRKWPIYGVAATDTTYTVQAGSSAIFRFDKPYVQFIIIKSGDADFSGE
jgi:hypothetical protein